MKNILSLCICICICICILFLSFIFCKKIDETSAKNTISISKDSLGINILWNAKERITGGMPQFKN